ncbi:MAG TPA: kynureninase [Burkholderiaceae bacterium]|nr:kynureninase [Burkholderiaceae bacterium]
MNAPRSIRCAPTREQFAALDAADRLAPLRQLFELPTEVIYLDGNSLGALPKATAERVQRTLRDEWGRGLITSWNHAGWIDLPRRIGDKIARLVGAAAGELAVADSTSINLFKVLWAALALQRQRAPQRRVIISERSNFPTDLYIAQSLAASQGCELCAVDTDQIGSALDDSVAVLMLTHVNYRTGRMHDMAALTAAAHAAGALTVWDLAHSAGAVPVDLNGAHADFAIGCGYKYLNGGPGAPAFVWVHARHAAHFEQPLTGWMGHAAPFEFGPDYRPAAGITRALCGTPPVLSMTALDCGVDTLLAAEPYGGMRALREKSIALTRGFTELVDARCADHGFTVVSPRIDAQRGSQVCLSHQVDGRDEGAYAIVQALIARGVIGDFRAGGLGLPDILRFGFTPLTLRFIDVWDAVEHLVQMMQSEEWKQPRFNQRHAVT